MPVVNPTHVVSFSSEDPHHPASNLLNREAIRKWKCKDAGEKEEYVILKFDKAETITSIDIGNCGAALIEVSVARSGGSGEPEFEGILNSTAFMSPSDSREGKNGNGVKSFSLNTLCKPVAVQKWDLVKVQVSQPFNRHVQYGLSFVKFVTAPDPNEQKKIGMFKVRSEVDSDDEGPLPGRLFSNKMNASPSTPVTSSSKSSTNSEIRDTANKILGAATSTSSSERDVQNVLKKSKPDVSSPVSSVNGNKPSRPNTGSSSPLVTAVRTSSSTASSSSPNTSKKRQLSPEPLSSSTKQSRTSSPSTSTNANKAKSVPKKTMTAKTTKPFNKLFEGVVFVLSGFQNPLRGELRDKAVQMGGRYKVDWDRTCTHLICAFYNTPKFREVRGAGNGQIVKKDWIEKSYQDKKRYPWRRYCLDRSDNGSESESEVCAESDGEEEIMENDEDEVPANSEIQDESKPKRKRILVMDSSDENESDKESKKAYEVDTDVDEDKTPDLSPSVLPSSEKLEPIFENMGFCLDKGLLGSDIAKNITNHRGKIFKTLTDDVEYYICPNFDWDEAYSDALSDNPNVSFVHSDWIKECHSANCLVDKDNFLLTPQ